MLPHNKTSQPQHIAAQKTETIGEQPFSRKQKTGWMKPSYGFAIIIVLILFGARQLFYKLEVPDGTETTASPKAAIPLPAQTLREVAASQSSEPVAEQPVMSQPAVEAPAAAAVTAQDSVAPEDEAMQIVAVTATKDGAKNTSPDRPVLKQKKPLLAKKTTPPEIITTSDLHNTSKKVLTVYFGNLRDGPSMKANIIGVGKKGDVVTDMRKKGEWHFVKLDDGRLGWMHQFLFAKPKTATEKSEIPEIKAAVLKRSPQPVPGNRGTVQPLGDNKTEPEKKEVSAPSMTETLQVQPDPIPETSTNKPDKTTKVMTELPVIPPAREKPIVRTDNHEASIAWGGAKLSF
jgi:uncharacterized protein YgiM (DUF1202 family)